MNVNKLQYSLSAAFVVKPFGTNTWVKGQRILPVCYKSKITEIGHYKAYYIITIAFCPFMSFKWCIKGCMSNEISSILVKRLSYFTTCIFSCT